MGAIGGGVVSYRSHDVFKKFSCAWMDDQLKRSQPHAVLSGFCGLR